jgi:long-chain acyl-CoA synthetase
VGTRRAHRPLLPGGLRVEALFLGFARKEPAREAVVCGGERVSYGELAASLDKLDLAPGERVPLHLPNGVEFVRRAYSVFASRGVLVPINTRLAEPEVEFLVNDINSEEKTDEDDCIILYTSGTTGRPKGAINTHANCIVQNVQHHGTAWRLREDDRFLATTPLAHRAGIARMFNALGVGGTLVVMEKFDAASALELIARERITVAGLPPTVLRLMLPELRAHPSLGATLRCVVVSAEAFPTALLRELAALLSHVRFHAVYGMSEAAVSGASHDEMLQREGTVGRPWPGVEVKIEDDELLVRGRDAVMKGYFNRPEANAEAFRDGWYATGDLARMDADGYLYIIDRKKDMVISGGYNVYSKELEQALLQHPDIEDAAVVGAPDPVYGEAVAAFVLRRPGAALTEEAVIAHCRARLADYKKPRHVVFTDALPRNALGKVLKSTLRSRIEALLCPRPKS